VGCEVLEANIRIDHIQLFPMRSSLQRLIPFNWLLSVWKRKCAAWVPQAWSSGP